MTRNQKIALGCGGAGCLGLIVVAIAVGVGLYFYQSATPRRNANINFNSNRNTNSNINSNSNENTDDDSTNTSSSNSSSSGSLSEDEQHRLYHAATMTGDAEVIRRVSVKLGLIEEDFSEGTKYSEFVGEHVAWAVRNYRWIADNLNTQEKARAYINEHLP